LQIADALAGADSACTLTAGIVMTAITPAMMIDRIFDPPPFESFCKSYLNPFG
jgi:hypothetical protein